MQGLPSKGGSDVCPLAQRLQNALVKEYTLNHSRIYGVWRLFVQLAKRKGRFPTPNRLKGIVLNYGGFGVFGWMLFWKQLHGTGARVACEGSYEGSHGSHECNDLAFRALGFRVLGFRV